MDFMRILRSLEEFLYEVMTWLVFYPKTFWISLTQPIATMRYSDQQQTLAPDEQYSSTLNPVLFLMLTLLIVHGAELAMRVQTVPAGYQHLPGFMQSDTNLLLTRSIFFGGFPLAFAITSLRRTHSPIDRNTLRAPFLAQCHVAAVFAMVVGLATIGSLAADHRLHQAAALIAGLITAWYLFTQTKWLAERLRIGPGPALGIAVFTTLWAGAAFVLAAALLSMF